MMGAALLFLLLFSFAVNGVISAIAGDEPVPPNKFYGNVSLNGEPAPAGTVINARIDGEPRGSVIVTEGEVW